MKEIIRELELKKNGKKSRRDKKQLAPLKWPFLKGYPLVDPERRNVLTTQLRRLHDWYLQYVKSTGNDAFPVRYKEEDFHAGDDVFYVEFSEIYQLYHQDALDVSMLRLWTL